MDEMDCCSIKYGCVYAARGSQGMTRKIRIFDDKRKNLLIYKISGIQTCNTTYTIKL